MPAMDRQYQAFKDQGVQTLAVNIAQTDFEVQNFVDKYGIVIPCGHRQNEKCYDCL